MAEPCRSGTAAMAVDAIISAQECRSIPPIGAAFAAKQGDTNLAGMTPSGQSSRIVADAFSRWTDNMDACYGIRRAIAAAGPSNLLPSPGGVG